MAFVVSSIYPTWPNIIATFHLRFPHSLCLLFYLSSCLVHYAVVVGHTTMQRSWHLSRGAHLSPAIH